MSPDEEENIPDLEPEDEEKAADEIAKALKGYLDHSEEGTLRYTSSDVSIVQEGDPRDPSMCQLQRRINGKEGSYRYISFQPLPQDLEERRAMNRAYLLDHKAAFDPAHLVSITMDGIARIFKGSVTASSTTLLPNLILICDTKNSQWRGQTIDDDMLR
jgi:hypothetical protein